eukprot:TRINITY_DN11774_c0_g1_i1.p1 TRINITY_DN11774_c0_g1~~TRINITY_DN11774_c0_g1_i1.p1  ORF type:complete len:242 (-),score=132.52 TRINITY_DN11774_c0_g1_i1:186-911(-)
MATLAFKIKLIGRKLDRKDGLLQKSDPYLIFKKGETVLYKSEWIKQTLDPDWEIFQLDSKQCGGMDYPLRLECWDWDSDTKSDMIGTVNVSLKELSHKGAIFKLANPKSEGKSAGKIIVDDATPFETEEMKEAREKKEEEEKAEYARLAEEEKRLEEEEKEKEKQRQEEARKAREEEERKEREAEEKRKADEEERLKRERDPEYKRQAEEREKKEAEEKALADDLDFLDAAVSNINSALTF